MDEKIVQDLIDRLIDLSFAEDIGDGDHTTLSSIPADAMGKSKLLIKEEGILAGIEIAKISGIRLIRANIPRATHKINCVVNVLLLDSTISTKTTPYLSF